MFALDFVRPIGDFISDDKFVKENEKDFTIRKNLNVFGSPKEFYYFTENKSFVKLLNKRYIKFIKIALEIEKVNNNLKYEYKKLNNFGCFRIELLNSNKNHDPIKIINLYKSTFNSQNKEFLRSKYANLLKHNEIRFLKVFKNYSNPISDLLYINNLDQYIYFFKNNRNDFCHNDFHKGNVMLRDIQAIIIDFEMSLLHRSNWKIDIINFFRDADIKVIEKVLKEIEINKEEWNFIIKFIAVKNLIVLKYLEESRNWNIDKEQFKFIKLFQKQI